jgi:hypothetical protein
MSCPLYREERYPCCHAIAEQVTPTLYERERYCRADEFAQCPTLQLMLRLRRRLHENEYLDIYLPQRP